SPPATCTRWCSRRYRLGETRPAPPPADHGSPTGGRSDRRSPAARSPGPALPLQGHWPTGPGTAAPAPAEIASRRSEEHTSELQSRENLVCRLLLEKKKT